MKNDTKMVTQTVTQTEKLCASAREVSANTECKFLVHHLKEKEVEWLSKSLEKLVRDRQKRGLLGELLTSVFE